MIARRIGPRRSPAFATLQDLESLVVQLSVEGILCREVLRPSVSIQRLHALEIGVQDQVPEARKTASDRDAGSAKEHELVLIQGVEHVRWNCGATKYELAGSHLLGA